MPEKQESVEYKKFWQNIYHYYILSVAIAILVVWFYHESTILNIFNNHENIIEAIEKENDLYIDRIGKDIADLKKPSKINKEALIQIVQESQPKLDPRLTERIVNTVLNQCKYKNVDPILITALIWKESRFDPFAESNKGALGLTQVMYNVWKETHELESSGVNCRSKLFWIEPNISAGIEIFHKYYIESDYDIVVTLNRYHTGSQKLPKGKSPNEVPYAMDILIQAYNIRTQLEKSY